jgi:hypothetical protein
MYLLKERPKPRGAPFGQEQISCLSLASKMAYVW